MESAFRCPAEAPLTAPECHAGGRRSIRRDVFLGLTIYSVSQGGHGIEPAGPAGGEEAGEERGRAEEYDRAREEERTVRRDLVELGGDQSAQSERSRKASDEAEEDRLHPLADDQAQDIESLRAERHADADLAGSLLDGVGDRAIDPNRREEERDPGKNAEQQHHETGLAERQADDFIHRLRLGEGDRRIDLGQGPLHQTA